MGRPLSGAVAWPGLTCQNWSCPSRLGHHSLDPSAPKGPSAVRLELED